MELARLDQARKAHADRGARGEDGGPRLDRDRSAQQIHPDGHRDERDRRQQAQDHVAAGDGNAPGRDAGVGFGRQHDEQAEDDDDCKRGQAERGERAGGVPGHREAAEDPGLPCRRKVRARMRGGR